ncbi:S41 family peptidase [Streptomyces fuscigenes]|uniref:S41 family peptidase n=1 Tax=Streptomyces fuscigenes TaxID=1528880 RepID=UPI001F29B356|nr:S41 family peptidase [Streptomyces fuscigenes]MCF3963069.1 S41 family peptidase [Streptomyces fuscigenes]
MPGSPVPRPRPRGFSRGAALTLVFAAVLGTAAATDCLPRTGESEHHGAPARAAAPRPGGTLDAAAVAGAAERATARGESGTDAAQQVVSRSGDRWSAVYDRGEYEEFEQALDGAYTGVGVGARRTADGLVEITRVQRGGPAQRAGVRPGDDVRTVDGRPIAGLPVTEVLGLLRGDRPGRAAARPGSTVALGLERDGRRTTRTLRRARLTVSSVSVEPLPGGARRIAVDSFTKGTGARVRQAVRDAAPGAGIVLDLRGNDGGLLSEAVTAASAFLDGGLVGTYDVKGRQHALYAQRGGDRRRPVVVLVDGGTMSAAELLTGALQDRGRAVVVGSRTFGKGSIQMPTKLGGGSVAELTVGHYRTPSGHAVDGRGIVPDVAGGADPQQRAETVLTGVGEGA